MNENKNIIKEGTYEGYLWYSDQKQPVIYTKENPLEVLQLDNQDNPFVIEGQLCDEKSHVSYSIKYVDGHYIIKEYDIRIQSSESCAVEDKCYQSNRIGNRILCFKECWITAPDPFCCDMEVLQPAQVIFVGFKK